MCEEDTSSSGLFASLVKRTGSTSSRKSNTGLDQIVVLDHEVIEVLAVVLNQEDIKVQVVVLDQEGIEVLVVVLDQEDIKVQVLALDQEDIEVLLVVLDQEGIVVLVVALDQEGIKDLVVVPDQEDIEVLVLVPDQDEEKREELKVMDDKKVLEPTFQERYSHGARLEKQNSWKSIDFTNKNVSIGVQFQF